MKSAAVSLLVVGAAAQIQGPFGSSGPFTSGYGTRAYGVVDSNTGFVNSGANPGTIISGMSQAGPFSGYGTRGNPSTVLSGLTSSGPFTSGFASRGMSPVSGFGSANPYAGGGQGFTSLGVNPFVSTSGFSTMSPVGARGYSLGVVDGSIPFGARGYGYGVTVAADDKGTFSVATIGSAKCVADAFAFWNSFKNGNVPTAASYPSHTISWYILFSSFV